MPFMETCRMEERIAMFRAYNTGAFSVAELTRRFGVSRETFYVWKRRRASGDERWFEDRSRAPGTCPQATGQSEIAAIIAEIRTLLHGFSRRMPASKRWRTLARRKSDELDAIIERTRAMKRVLGNLLRCECPTLEDCGRAISGRRAS